MHLSNRNVTERSASGMNTEPRIDSSTRSALVAALRAVLDLHKPEMLGGTEFCENCGPTLYPCSTVRAIETALQEES